MKSSVLSTSLISKTDDSAISAMPGVDAVYASYGKLVARWCARLAGPSNDVEDLVQEVFMVVQKRIHTWNPDVCKMTTWLYAVTSNVVRSARRKNKWRKWFSLDSPEENQFLELPSLDIPVEGQLEKQEEVKRVHRALELLPDKYRESFILFELEQLSAAEISELTSVPVNTVYVHLHRARKLFVETYAQCREAEDTP